MRKILQDFYIRVSLSHRVRSFSDLEQAMNCVERVVYYNDTVQQEPFAPPANAIVPTATWPARGAIEFRDYQVSYLHKVACQGRFQSQRAAHSELGSLFENNTWHSSWVTMRLY